MKRINLSKLAREIVASNQYMTLGTVNADGRAWVSPVVYFYDSKWNLYFMSLPGSRHGQNISRSKMLSLAIFDSHQLLGLGVGLQIEGEAKVMPVSETIRVINLFLSRKWPYGKPSNIIDTRRFFRVYKYRCYKVSPTKVWMNDPREKTDVRVKVRI